jgi:hypothetical protein
MMTMDNNNSLDLKGGIVLNIGRNKKLVKNANGSFALFNAETHEVEVTGNNIDHIEVVAYHRASGQ